jgi:hypothetical protein
MESEPKGPQMSLSLAIILIVLLDAALIGLLAFVMSRANRLTPHVSSRQAMPTETPATEAAQPDAAPASRRPRRSVPARALTARS